MTRPQRWLLALKIAVTCALLVWLTRQFDWANLSQQLFTVERGKVVLAWSLLALPLLLTALRWHLLLQAQNLPVPMSQVFALGFSAHFFNAFLPGTTGGDALRGYHAIQYCPRDKTRVVLSLVVDRLMGMAGYALLAIGSVMLLPRGSLDARTLCGIALAAGCLAGLLVALWWLPNSIFGRGLRRVTALLRLEALSAPTRLFWRLLSSDGRTLALSVVLSLLSALCLAVTLGLLLRSLQLHASYAVVIFVTSAVTVLTAIPVSLGGHGVREVSLISLLAGLGVTASGDLASAIALSLLLVAGQLSWGMVGGIVYLFGVGPTRQKGLR